MITAGELILLAVLRAAFCGWPCPTAAMLLVLQVQLWLAKMATSVLELDSAWHVVVSSNDKDDAFHPPGQYCTTMVMHIEWLAKPRLWTHEAAD